MQETNIYNSSSFFETEEGEIDARFTDFGDLAGFLIIGPSGKSLFLPMGGFRYDTHYFSVGTKGFYWTASRAKAGEDPSDWAITFDNYMISINVFSNLNAFLVRPVLDKKPHKINEFYNHLPE